VAIVWRHIAQSQQGASHLSDGTACQDSNLVRVLGDGRANTLVACVADGAGSAKFADAGSAIACTAIIENAAAHYEASGGFDRLSRDDVLRWCEDARSRIENEAALRECNCRELATTLCVVIAAPNSTIFFQIGDGAIIVGARDIFGVVFWPQSGEYANSTNFLTADDYDARLEFLTITNRCSDLALFTDGLERLALRFDSKTPHEPFFTPLFRALRSADDLAGLSAGLSRFLASESVQARSDDDKTLILASRCDSDDAA
jgi:Protein phosphatase 2C